MANPGAAASVTREEVEQARGEAWLRRQLQTNPRNADIFMQQLRQHAPQAFVTPLVTAAQDQTTVLQSNPSRTRTSAGWRSIREVLALGVSGRLILLRPPKGLTRGSGISWRTSASRRRPQLQRKQWDECQV